MKAYVDHADGMERYPIGDLHPNEIADAEDALRGGEVWITDFQGNCDFYAYSGYRIMPDGSGGGEIIFEFK